MITKNNFSKILIETLGFIETSKNIYTKNIPDQNINISADFNTFTFNYNEIGIDTGDNTTATFKTKEDGKEPNENLVVFLAVTKLLLKGYKPSDIFLEKSWQLGRTAKHGKADITVYKDSNAYLIIECKTAGKEFKEARKNLFDFGALRKDSSQQLFSYWQQARSTQWLSLYALDYDEQSNKLNEYEEIIKSYDDKNIILTVENDNDNETKLFKNASEAIDAFEVWDETYNKKTYQGLIFGDDSEAYKIGVIPLKKKYLKTFSNNEGVAKEFAEILRHNNISDKENAFNKLLSLFVCKLVDERQKNDDDIVDFQYKEGTDDYYSLYERLLKLFQTGMKDFLREDVFYLDNDYISKTINDYTGKKRKALEDELKKTFQKTKMLSCQVFAFREVYNEKLFFQNGKILAEVVNLFQKYKLSYTSKEQFLGNLFENLLSAGFKQDEGQYFTPIPITRFIWNSLPYEKYVNLEQREFPKVIDFACGSGHFLTEGVSAISDYCKSNEVYVTDSEISKTFYGIDKDNRLARVSKVAMFLNGADNAQIRSGDGLEHDDSFLGEKHSFDILVANPPYSVDRFKTHESKTVLNTFETIKLMTENTNAIQDVFLERAEELLQSRKKNTGICAIIVNNTILKNTETWDIKTRDIILRNFYIKGIVNLKNQTFAQTNTSVVILFLQHFEQPPKKATLIEDTVNAIISCEKLVDWHDEKVFQSYLKKIEVKEDDWKEFINGKYLFEQKIAEYFKEYNEAFLSQTDIISLLENIKNAPEKIEPPKKGKTKSELQNELFAKYLNFIQAIEKEKIIAFALTFEQETLIINAPDETKEQQRFLGYKVSERNHELKLIETKGDLSNKENRYDDERLAFYMKSFLSNNKKEIPEKLSKNNKALYTYTCDLLDFSQPYFKKTFDVSRSKKIEIGNNLPSEKLKKLVETPINGLWEGEKPPFKTVSVLRGKNFTMTGKIDLSDIAVINVEKNDYEKRTLVDGDIIIEKSGGSETQAVGRVVLFENIPGDYSFCNFTARLRVIDKRVSPKYLHIFLNYLYEMGFTKPLSVGSGGLKNLDFDKYLTVKIPIPEKKIQDAISEECSKIDNEADKAEKNITTLKNKIETLYSSLYNNSEDRIKLSNKENFDLSIGTRILDSEMDPDLDIPVYSSNTFIPFGYIDKLLIQDFDIPSVIWGIDDNWQVNCLPSGYKFYPTDHIGVLRLKSDILEPKYVAYALYNEGRKINFSRTKRASLEAVKEISLPLPSIDSQREVIKKVIEYENEIRNMRKIIKEAISKKQTILEDFLK